MPTRRQFVGGAAALAGVAVTAPQNLSEALARGRRSGRLLRGGHFPDAVISGDPTPTGITLWTRVSGVSQSGAVRLEVARDRGFRHVVARELIRTSAASGHTAKARVAGLKPHERYWYRFETADRHSPVGRFQTAPAPGSRETVRFAFFSCLEFSYGYYNALALMARDDVDFVLNLGDYIYADLSFPRPAAVRTTPLQEAFTLNQYREKYRIYRSDPSLRAMHARFSMLSCWDDHEVRDDYAGADPHGGGTQFSRPYTVARRNAAYRAFFENMPHFPVGRKGTRLYHTASFGRTLDVFVLDERQYRAAQPCGDLTAAACGDLGADRALLGAQQLAFARSRLHRSKATWKVIANEVMIMPTKVDAQTYEGFDSWQGYPTEREALLAYIQSAGVENVVFATGDYHAFVAGDVQSANGAGVAPEFVGGSISSPATSPGVAERGLLFGEQGTWGTFDHPVTPAATYQARRAANPWYTELDYDHHGYALAEASRNHFKVTFRKLDTVHRRSTATVPGRSWTLQPGQRSIAGI